MKQYQTITNTILKKKNFGQAISNKLQNFWFNFEQIAVDLPK